MFAMNALDQAPATVVSELAITWDYINVFFHMYYNTSVYVNLIY